MEQSDSQYAQEKLAQLKTDYQVEVVADWGEAEGSWNPGTWSAADVARLYQAIALMADAMGGSQGFARHLGGVTVKKADIGPRGGQALAHDVTLSIKGSFTTWTVVHEFAHAWDANYGWRLSRELEKYTRGFTSPTLAYLKRLVRLADSGVSRAENRPGRFGRRPGCNQAGYFYGDKPSGSNWAFNRKEDFAEAIPMYLGWGRDNDLSTWAKARIDRYLCENGTVDKNFGADNWADYRKYFYPESGDYTRTKRWQFVEDLMKGRIEVRQEPLKQRV